jgi:putative Mn2+ efflux pump MntP
MEFLDIILIGIALSIDACAITIANCNIYKKELTKKNLWLMPLMFGLFQAIMPLTAYYIGTTFAEYAKSFAGYITCAIFFILAIKILIDIIGEIKEKPEDNEKEKKQKKFSVWLVTVQALATSIDAFIIGLTFSLSYTMSIYLAIAIIFSITFILVSLAILLGKSLGTLFGKYANWIGFAILLILAIKELIFAIVG